MNHTNTLPSHDHFISLEKAATMTETYRDHRETILADQYRGRNLLAKSETFNRAAIEKLLAEKNCAGMRIYYGMDESLACHAILVAVNAANEDILPNATATADAAGDVILEEGQRCPDLCPPKSPLN